VTNTTGYLPYTITVPLSVGTHSFQLLFDNDAFGGSSSTDRNAYIDYVTIADPPSSTNPTSSASNTPVATSNTSVPAPAAATPVPGTGTPLSGTATPLSGTATPLSGTATPLSGTATPLSGTATPLSGTAYYVDCTSGADTNSGTSPTSA